MYVSLKTTNNGYLVEVNQYATKKSQSFVARSIEELDMIMKAWVYPEMKEEVGEGEVGE